MIDLRSRRRSWLIAGTVAVSARPPPAAPRSCGSTTHQPVSPTLRTPPRPTLHVGDQEGTGAEALLQAAGLLNTLPFKVQFDDFTSGPPMLQAMGSGSIDVGGVGDAPPVFAAASGEKIAVIGAYLPNVASSATRSRRDRRSRPSRS